MCIGGGKSEVVGVDCLAELCIEFPVSYNERYVVGFPGSFSGVRCWRSCSGKVGRWKDVLRQCSSSP